MSRERADIGHDDVIAEGHVVRDVAVREQIIMRADRGEFAVAGGAVDGDVFAEGVFITDDRFGEARWRIRARDFPKAFRRVIFRRENASMSVGLYVSRPLDGSILRAVKQTTHTVARSHAEAPSHRFGSPKGRPRPGEHPERL